MKKFYLLMMFALLGMVANAQNVVFYESFDQNAGTGGNDGAWSGDIAKSDVKYDNDGWVYTNVKGANKCIKLGSKSGKGEITTPAISLNGNGILTFKAGAWSGDKLTVSLSIANGGELSMTTIDLSEASFMDYTVEITNATVNSTITFSANDESKNRFFLDEVKVVSAGEVDPNQVVAPTFSLASGTYFNAQELILSCETEGAKVFYTIDNGEGVSEDREYSEPIQLTNGIYEINAWATKEGFETSSTVSVIYEIKVIPFEEINVENVKEGKYIIAYNDVETGKSYIMKNEVISQYYVGAEEFDLTTNTPAETDLFVVKQTEGGYTIQNSENTYVALQVSGSHINLKPQEADPFVWNFAKSENGNIVATGQEIDSYMSFKMYNNRIPEFLAEKNGNYPMFYFVSGTSSVNDAVVNEFKAVAVANGIEVNVAEAGLVSVYNAAGQLVANVNVAEGTTTINVAGGFYIVKAGNNVAKVLVK